MKVAVGLSGGVDSTVAALLLKERGFDVVGVTMTLGRDTEAASLDAARRTARQLDVPLVEYDLSAAWRREVLDDLRAVYRAGETPNPCVRCNEKVKFGLLPAAAFRDGCDRFATGHYARVSTDGFLRAADPAKDQSYFLYRVAPNVRARLLLPLGDWKKDDVRAYAMAHGLAVGGAKDSQDFCGGDPLAVLGETDRDGAIVDAAGRVLGRHRGYWHYTVGKRKGLGIGGGIPYYVTGLDAARNEVVVGTREEALCRRFSLRGVVGLGDGRLEGVSVKVRSAGAPCGPVSVDVRGEGAEVVCEEGLAGVAPGQSAVFYRGDLVLGGGFVVSGRRT